MYSRIHWVSSQVGAEREGLPKQDCVLCCICCISPTHRCCGRKSKGKRINNLEIVLTEQLRRIWNAHPESKSCGFRIRSLTTAKHQPRQHQQWKQGVLGNCPIHKNQTQGQLTSYCLHWLAAAFQVSEESLWGAYTAAVSNAVLVTANSFHKH